MIIYTIYKATCIVNDKIYIGFTNDFALRQQGHHQKSLKPECHFHLAIKKYGWSNFKWEIIYQSLDGDHCLEVMEPYFIGYYDSFANGYNSTLGGEAPMRGRTHSQETKNLMSMQRKGRNVTDEFRKKMSKLRKGVSLPKQTQETIQKRSLKLLGQKRSLEYCNNQSVMFAQEWEFVNPLGEKQTIYNLKQFCKENGLSPGNMHMVYNGKRKYHKGWTV